MILFDRVSKSYIRSERKALDNINLFIDEKEFVVLVGSSGAGKSTLLKLITREELPSSGHIEVGGLDYDYLKAKDIPKLRRKLGFVWQDFKLLTTKTVFENIAFTLQITGETNSRINYVLPKVIKMVGLTGKEWHMPDQLSGGEKQRVAIARSLVSQPRILIADEPTGNLDIDNAWKIIQLLVKINSLGTTVILATHNNDIVAKLNHRVIRLEDGRIIGDGKPLKKTPKPPAAKASPKKKPARKKAGGSPKKKAAKKAK